MTDTSFTSKGSMPDGHVDTVYGPMPGCPECGVIPMSQPHLCEHGVTPAMSFEVSFTTTFESWEAYSLAAYGVVLPRPADPGND
jgi:hypothetical protein